MRLFLMRINRKSSQDIHTNFNIRNGIQWNMTNIIKIWMPPLHGATHDEIRCRSLHKKINGIKNLLQK